MTGGRNIAFAALLGASALVVDALTRRTAIVATHVSEVLHCVGDNVLALLRQPMGKLAIGRSEDFIKLALPKFVNFPPISRPRRPLTRMDAGLWFKSGM